MKMTVTCPECGKKLKDDHALQSHVSAKHAKIERTPHKPKNTGKLLLFGAIIILGIGILFYALTPAPTYDVMTENGKNTWGTGNITIVEYADFQCPACQQSFIQMQQIKEQFGSQITIEFRHLPLRNIHPFAQKAAEAAECAGDQGKFWEYHDELFNRAPQIPRGVLVSVASDIGLDSGKFNACLDSGSMAKRVEEDFQSGIADKVQATPTYFINGKKHEGVLSITTFRSFLE